MYKVLFLSKSKAALDKLLLEFSRNNFTCQSISCDDNLLEQVNTRFPDLLVIDTGSIPEEQLCRYLIFEKKLPILALTSMEVALNLDGTVDDFVLNTSSVQEIIVRARRLINKKTKIKGLEQIIIKDLVIDTLKYEVHIGNKPISLTFREYELLKFLATNPGRVFSRDALLNGVWGDDFFGGDRTVDVHIRRLRSKIEDQTHIYIETVRNIGYRFIKT